MRLLLSIALLTLACAEDRSTPDSGSQIDAAADAGTEDGGADRDASEMDAAFDSGVMRDAAVTDGSVTGTTLEGITLDWTDELVRCAHWLQGDDLARAEAQKVQVTLAPHPRTSLEP